MRPFRVIVIDSHGSVMLIVRLDRAPDRGEDLMLPDGRSVEVRHVISSDDPAVDNVIIARSPT